MTVIGFSPPPPPPFVASNHQCFWCQMYEAMRGGVVDLKQRRDCRRQTLFYLGPVRGVRTGGPIRSIGEPRCRRRLTHFTFAWRRVKLPQRVCGGGV